MTTDQEAELTGVCGNCGAHTLVRKHQGLWMGPVCEACASTLLAPADAQAARATTADSIQEPNKNGGYTPAYVHRHWRGHLSLAKSFWVNFVLVNVLIWISLAYLATGLRTEYSRSACQVVLGFSLLRLLVVLPWQLVGVWRASGRRIASGTRTFWARCAQLVVVLQCLGTLANLVNEAPVYRYLLDVSLNRDAFGGFTVEATANGRFIHVRGGIGIELARKTLDVLEHNSSIEGVILDSLGGSVSEGRALGKVIRDRRLDTYTLQGCHSACTLAFIEGAHRYLGTGANLGFHRYSSLYTKIDPGSELVREQDEDRDTFRRQGVKNAFVERLFNAPSNDLWYPAFDELIDAGVVHGRVDPSQLVPIQYKGNPRDFDAVVSDLPGYGAIKKYAPDIYESIRRELREQVNKGATQLELQRTVADQVRKLASRTLPAASDETVLEFARVMVEVLTILRKRDPFLCLKQLHPQKFGPLDSGKHLPEVSATRLLSLLATALEEASAGQSPRINAAAAEKVLSEIVESMGDDAEYVDAQSLENRAEYDRACGAAIRFYELILEEDTPNAANAMRFALTLE